MSSGELRFGNKIDYMPEHNIFALGINGGYVNNPSEPTLFYYDADSSSNSNSIITEYHISNDPIEMHLKAKNWLKAGDYAIKLTFTYFNGRSWDISSQNLNIHVNSFLEQYLLAFQVLGLMLALISILPNLTAGLKMLLGLPLFRKLYKKQEKKIAEDIDMKLKSMIHKEINFENGKLQTWINQRINNLENLINNSRKKR